MKRVLILLSLLIILSLQYSCKKTDVAEPVFKDMEKYSIYDYIVENKVDYSSFLSILEKSHLDETLSAYNQKGLTYTLFLPDNNAVDKFIKESDQYSSLDDLLKDTTYIKALARYHVLTQGFLSSDFPFGTFSVPTLSGDYLNVNFILGTDTTYYKINNQADVIKVNVKGADGKYLSNGYIHVIGTMLKPIVYNSYEWLKANPGYSIFTSAIEATGINEVINVNMKLKDQPLRPFTMLVEPDSIYQKRNIFKLEDLEQAISPGRTDYQDSTNQLNLFVRYHILTDNKFLDNLQGQVTNYNTFADIPLNINGTGLDILINKGKEIFVSKGDTTDYITIYYDASNVNTQSGAIHFINQILKPQVPSPASVTFEFYEELFLNAYRQQGGTYLIENENLLDYVKWTGAKLYYVKSLDVTEQANSHDYLKITGDFTISYQLPKIIQGKYDVFLRADAYNSENALVELYVDGNKVGGLIDLTTGGSATNPYAYYEVGTIEFKNYAAHIVEIKSLIPGRFIWDYISFELPIN